MTPVTQEKQAEKKARAIAKFREGCTWREVAAAIDVNFTTIWRWGQKDPEFAKAVRDAGSDADDEVESVTFQNAVNPDPAHNVLRMFWLKSRKGYTDRQDITSKGEPVGTTVVQLPIKDLHADNQAERGPADSSPSEHS